MNDNSNGSNINLEDWVSFDEKDITRTNMPDTHPIAVECCIEAMKPCQGFN